MSELYSVAGWKIFIGDTTMQSQAADFTASDYSGQTWTEIDGWEQMGAFGDAAQAITTSLINRGRDIKTKGTKNAGSMDNRFAALLGTSPDAGQTAVIAAEGTPDNYAFKIEANDVPSSGPSPTPTTFYFIGLVMNKTMQGGGANSTQLRGFNVEINSNIVEVAAADGS